MTGTSETAAREAVVAAARGLHTLHLSAATSGNVSCRWDDGMLITPTAIPYNRTEPEDLVHVGVDGSVRAGRHRPSSEWRFHLAAYAARPDREAVVHCHSTHATILACAHRGIPAFHYMVAMAGGDDIPCVPYAAFGTAELAQGVSRGLAARTACLLANHGQVAMGRDPADALDLAWIVEDLARQYLGVLQLGEVHLLDEAEMARVVGRFAEYRPPHR